MPKERGAARRALRWWLWCGVAIVAAVVLVFSVAAGLVWFLSDPQPGSETWLEMLSWRAGVVSMVTGTVLGTAALVVSLVALRAQARAERGHTQVPAPGPASPSSSQTAGVTGWPDGHADDHQRSYGGDHIEFRDNTFHGHVIGKQVSGPSPGSAPAASDDEN